VKRIRKIIVICNIYLIYYFLSESEVFKGTSQTETLARPRFEIFRIDRTVNKLVNIRLFLQARNRPVGIAGE